MVAKPEIIDDMTLKASAIDASGEQVDRTLQVDWLNGLIGDEAPYRANAAGKLSLFLTPAGDAIYAKGRAELSMEAKCVRCLESLQLEIAPKIEVTLFEAGKEPKAAPSGEVTQEDMGVILYEKDTIELGAFVRDEAYLEIPMNPVCSDSCRGLCPTCGTNQNQSTCQCEPSIDPRWQGLKDLKLN